MTGFGPSQAERSALYVSHQPYIAVQFLSNYYQRLFSTLSHDSALEFVYIPLATKDIVSLVVWLSKMDTEISPRNWI